MRPRIPLAYASLLIIALVAVIGFAAFSPSSPTSDDAGAPAEAEPTPEASARVASAVLAVRIADADTRVATTQSAQTAPEVAAEAPAPTSTSPSTTAAEAPAPDTTDAPSAEAAVVTTPKDTTPPPIKVTSHKDGHTVTKRIVTFEGTSEPGAVVTSGPYTAEMAENGDWEMSLVVVEGANGAVFTATDDAGNSSSVRVVVHYDETTNTTKPATTTTKPKTTTTSPSPTTTQPSAPKWSPNWPADAGGDRDVEYWRSTVEQYWPADRVDCALGIIKRESNGDPRAYNASSSAEGLMQHLSKYWHSRARGAGFVDGNGLVATPYNAAANIAAGASLANYYDSAIGQWWNPWKSGGGVFTAQYGSCQSDNPS